MNSDPLIFTLDDVREVRKVSVNIDDFEDFAKEVQRNYLQKLLTDPLYTSLILDTIEGVPQSKRFKELVDGVTYDYQGSPVIYRGVKLYCCYVWLHMNISQGAINHTPTGTMIFKDDDAEHAEKQRQYSNASAHYINSADGLEEPIKRFLDRHKGKYPEWVSADSVEVAEDSNYENFKVFGNTYKGGGRVI